MKKTIVIIYSLLIGLSSCMQDYPKNSEIVVATYNLRFNNPEDSINAWPNRKTWVKDLIRFHDFELLGTQEGLIDQITYLAEMEEYGYVGLGRDDGKEAGEHSAIFYKKERFDVLDHGDFWLSETPLEPSFGWDALKHKRICSWAKLHDKNTRMEFFFFSVHYDHQGQIARVESSKLILRKIDEISKGSPVIFVGDLNSRSDSEAISILDKQLKDAYKITQTLPYGPEGTTNNFNWNGAEANRIDYIYVTDNISVLKYGCLTDSREKRYPSDHFPVTVTIKIN